MEQKFLVIGGKGKTGKKVVDRLQSLGKEVRSVSRSSVPSFDWEDKITWADALEGVDKMYVTYQPDLAVPASLDAIESLVRLARNSGIEKVVLLSGKGEHQAELCEQVVINSGIDFTIVRASWFNQNFSEGFFLDPIISGMVALPHADKRVPYVDTDDIADVVVEALLHDRHDGKTYELTGPRLMSFKDVMNEISVATGRSISFTEITPSAYTQMLGEAGVPPDYIWLINYLFTEVLGSNGTDMVTNHVEQVLGRKPKDFTTYAREVAATGVWKGEFVL